MKEDFKLRLFLNHIVRRVNKTGKRSVYLHTVRRRLAVNVDPLDLAVLINDYIPEATDEVFTLRIILACLPVLIAAATC